MEQKISHGMDDINGNVRLGISAASFPKRKPDGLCRATEIAYLISISGWPNDTF